MSDAPPACCRPRARSRRVEVDTVGDSQSGKNVVLRGMTISRFANGKIVEEWMSMDNLALMTQLGIPAGVADAPDSVSRTHE